LRNAPPYRVVPEALWELGADVISIGVDPDGLSTSTRNADRLRRKALEPQVCAKCAPHIVLPLWLRQRAPLARARTFGRRRPRARGHRPSLKETVGLPSLHRRHGDVHLGGALPL